jgi:hypothetical protein
MSGLLRATEDDDNPILDGHLHDRRASESCGSSAVGEPMALDLDPPLSRGSHSSHTGAKRVRRKHVNRANLLVSSTNLTSKITVDHYKMTQEVLIDVYIYFIICI